MVLTVEELKRLEDTDIRDLKWEELDNAGDDFKTFSAIYECGAVALIGITLVPLLSGLFG